MNITFFNPQDSFTKDQLHTLSNLGNVTFTKTRDALPTSECIDMAKNADIIVCDPDPLGGFEKAKEELSKVIESTPTLKGICLSTTSFGWIDLDLCKKRNIPVCNIPGYSKESVAEQAIAFLLGAAKRIFISDRRTQKGTFSLYQGFELKGKTLGIIGLGSIGGNVAKLAHGIGMDVIAYNRTPMSMDHVTMVPLDALLAQSDAITLHTTHEVTNNNMIGEKELLKMKKGVIVINTVDRELVDEDAMAKALETGAVDTYVYEGEDLVHTPLAHLENAIGFKGFAWYTKEALENLHQILVSNIIACVEGKPQNRVA
jgi:glycerate dehydrogenase